MSPVNPKVTKAKLTFYDEPNQAHPAPSRVEPPDSIKTDWLLVLVAIVSLLVIAAVTSYVAGWGR